MTNNLKIGLVGYGAMGRMIETQAQKSGHQVIARIDPFDPKADSKELTYPALKQANVIIDFSQPQAVTPNLEFYLSLKIPVVMGTTGWYQQLASIKKEVERASFSFLWSTNFSLGVNVFFRIVEEAAKFMNSCEDYDVWAYELHHSNKSDSPSGTAKTLSDILLKKLARKEKAVFDKLDRKRDAKEIQFSSVRGGEVNFEHTIGFDSPADTILLKHAARDRSGYAAGAVKAAEWLVRQPVGFYDFEAFMKELLNG